MKSRFLRFKTTKQGSVLILVMVTMLIMSSVIMVSIQSSKDDTQATYRAVFAVQSRYLAEGALERAKGDVLSQIAATNFLGGSFATVGQLYANINNRFNVASNKIPTNVEARDIDWKAPATISRAQWNFADDATLAIPGISDWGIGDDASAEPLGAVRAYITRSFIDEQGDPVNNAVGSFQITLTGWAQTGSAILPVTTVTSKSYSHALIFPRLFDFLYLGNALSDCSMCHLKIMGDIGQVNPDDPFEMHIAYNSARFNRLTLYGSIFTNGDFRRRAQGEGPDDTRGKQERMMFNPGGDNDYAKPEQGIKPKMLIWARNGTALANAWAAESNPGENPFRSIDTLANPLPTTWPSVKKNLLEWFEPRAVAAANANASELRIGRFDNNIGYLVVSGTTNDNALPWIRPTTLGRPVTDPADNWQTRPVTYFQPYWPINTWNFAWNPAATYSPADTYNPGVFPFRNYPFMVATLLNDGTRPRIPYGVQDYWTETVNSSFTSVSNRVTPGDGIPDYDLNEDGVIDAVDDSRRIYLHAIDRAPNRWNVASTRQNVEGNADGRLIFNRGLHAADDFDYDTIPNAFDPDLDGDGIPESPRVSNNPDNLGFYVTTQAAIDNGWIVWVNANGEIVSNPGPNPTSVPGLRPQWTLGYQRLRFASTVSPFAPTGPTYWVRLGALEYQPMSATGWTSSAEATARTNGINASTAHANTANITNNILTTPPTGQGITNVDIIAWPPTSATSPLNPNPATVWTNFGTARCWPRVFRVMSNANKRFDTTSNDGSRSYRRANQDVMTASNISQVYRILDENPINLVNRRFAWQAQVTGIASAGNGFTAMQNLILNQQLESVAGVFPNAVLQDGDPVLSTDPGTRSLIIKGSDRNPIRLTGDVVVRGDIVISGDYTGKGVIIAHRNIFIPQNLRYQNPPNYFDFSSTGGDQLGLIAAGNIMVGNLLHNTSGRNDLMEFVWGNMVDINSADISGGTPWNYGRDGTASPAHNHMINPVYLFDGHPGGWWQNGEWNVINAGNCVDERFNAQGMRLGGGLVADASNPAFDNTRRHVNFNGDSNPSTTNDATSHYRNFWISTPGLLPEGASRIDAMPPTFFGTYNGGWFGPYDFKMFTLHPREGSTNWTNTFRNTETENANNWAKHIEGVLYADFGVIGGNLATIGQNFMEFRGAIIGRDIQILSARQNNTGESFYANLKDGFGTYRVGGLYYDHRLKGAINPLGFPFTEKFLGGEMAHNFLPPLVDGDRDNWLPFRLGPNYRFMVEE